MKTGAQAASSSSEATWGDAGKAYVYDGRHSAKEIMLAAHFKYGE